MKKPGGFGVAASPFNPIKAELALLLLGAFIVWMLLDFVFVQPRWVWPVLACYSIAASIWLILRTRHILKQNLRTHHGAD